MRQIVFFASLCVVLASLGCAKSDTRRALCDTLAKITGVPISDTKAEVIERDLKSGFLGHELVSAYSILEKRVGGSHCVVWEPQALMDGRNAFPLYVRARTKGGDPEFLVIFYADGSGKVTDIECRDSIQFREGY
jgi:hypothetical protein